LRTELERELVSKLDLTIEQTFFSPLDFDPQYIYWCFLD
jgi:hypothetical protein